jgi:hypothetical protein
MIVLVLGVEVCESDALQRIIQKLRGLNFFCEKFRFYACCCMNYWNSFASSS